MEELSKIKSLIKEFNIVSEINDVKLKSDPWQRSAEYFEDIYSVRLETLQDLLDTNKPHEAYSNLDRVAVVKDLQFKIPRISNLVENLKNHMNEDVIVYDVLINDSISITVFCDLNISKIFGYFDF